MWLLMVWLLTNLFDIRCIFMFAVLVISCLGYFYTCDCCSDPPNCVSAAGSHCVSRLRSHCPWHTVLDSVYVQHAWAPWTLSSTSSASESQVITLWSFSNGFALFVNRLCLDFSPIVLESMGSRNVENTYEKPGFWRWGTNQLWFAGFRGSYF